MGLFDDLGDLFLPEAPMCEECRDERDADVYMEAGERYAPRQGMAVSAWICPECDHTVMRDAGDGVEMYDPPGGDVGSGGDRDGGGSTGVVPLDGDVDDDEGWRSVR